MDDLVDEALFVTNNLPSQRDIQIFKRNRKKVSDMQPPKGFGTRIGRTSEPNARKVRVRIKHGDEPARQYENGTRKANGEELTAASHTGNSSCNHADSGRGSAVRSSTSFSSTSRLVGGFERSARSDFAINRIALVSSRFDL
jgi:hypothetical protein